MDLQIPTSTTLLKFFHDREAYFDKTYTHMKRATIKEGLKRSHGVKIAMRTLDRYLKRYKNSGLLKTFPQERGRKPNGTFYGVPPNRSLTIKGAVWLKRQGVFIAKWLWDHLRGIVKHPRSKGPDKYKNGSPRESAGEELPPEILKLIPTIGKSFS